MPGLFDTISIGGLELSNRIVVSPMCQFAASDGTPGTWHYQHLGGLSQSGAGLLILESTAVSKNGRISTACLGLYDDAHTAAHTSLVKAIQAHSNITLGIQLAHSGRKGSVKVPWEGEAPLPHDEGGWETVAPSALAWSERPSPRSLDRNDMERILDDYKKAAVRAVSAGYQLLELHAAHGYLLHQFLSPLTNVRTDGFGGDAIRRMRFPLEVFRAIRQAVPSNCALGVRLSGSDWHPNGNRPEDAALFAQRLEELGADYVVVSSGGIIPKVQISVTKGYQVPMACSVKQQVNIPVMAVGMIGEAKDADALVRSGTVDFVALGRAFLDDPRWGWRAAAELGANLTYPFRYQAVDPRYWQSPYKSDACTRKVI